MLLPRPVRIAKAHEHGAAVAVDVARDDAGPRQRARIRAVHGADESPLVEGRVHAVRRHARQHIDRARVEQARHALVLAVAVEQLVDEVQRRHAPRPLGSVHVAVDDDRRLLGGGPARAVRQREEPDRTALRCRADALELDEVRPRSRPLLRAAWSAPRGAGCDRRAAGQPAARWPAPQNASARTSSVDRAALTVGAIKTCA